jgi:hypothetical protein
MSATSSELSQERSTAVLTRREAILRVSALLGGAALIGQSALLAGCASGGPLRAGTRFSASDVALLDEIADTILPETSTPGAKAAGVGPFIAHMVENAYSPQQQRVFHSGFAGLDERAARELGMSFLAATPAARLAFVERLDREQYEYTRARAPGTDPHWFRMVKELTLLGYFTSEIGYHQAQRYIETPGSYDPCVPYAPGDRAWAPHA